MAKAPRLLFRLWRGSARGVLPLVCLWLAGPGFADIEAASYKLPTGAYGHNVLPGGEYAALEIQLSGGRVLGVGTHETVYEDTAPRLIDLDGDGDNELITVISYFDAGAAVRIFDEVPSEDHPNGSTVAVVAETPPIGTRFRWLGIVGAADIDGDGAVEIAYIDRPHLAKTLRIWRYNSGTLTQVASLPGYTNHRIGEEDIAGGIRTCDGAHEMILATANWRQLVALRWDGTQFIQKTLGSDTSRSAFAKAMECQ